MERRLKHVTLSIAAAMVIIYSVMVMWFVATSPDLRLRCLLLDVTDIQEDSWREGVELCGSPVSDEEDIQRAVNLPQVGDDLLSINEMPTNSFFDFCNRIWELRSAEIPPGGRVQATPGEPEAALSLRELAESPAGMEDRFWALENSGYPPLVDVVFEEGEHQREVKVEFKKRNGETKSDYVPVVSLPTSEIVLTLTWFFIQMTILVLGGVTLWNRPLDRSLQVFFGLCIVTLGAFVGGYHWWIIAGSPLLNIPFIVCACLLPAVTLHFFLTFPRSHRWVAEWPLLTNVLVYLPAVLSMCALVAMYLATWSINGSSVSEKRIEDVTQLLSLLRQTILVSIVVAAIYFVLTIFVLVTGFLTTRNPLERRQVKWILWAALFAAVPIAYTIHLALNDRIGFVLGGGRVPMFVASLSFMLAYSFSILPERFQFGDDVAARGRLYYAVSLAMLIAFAVMISTAILLPQILSLSLTTVQKVAVFAIIVGSVVMMMWLRDQFQQTIDRRFFQEKYGLDKALQRIRQAARQTVDPDSLAEMMMGTCVDVLHTDRIGMYFRNPQDGAYRLMALRNADDLPLTLQSQELIDALREGAALQRIRSASRESMSPVQEAIHDLDAVLLYPLESDANPIGVVVLGQKKNKLNYTAEDLTFLHAMSQVTAVALQSARLNQNMTRLNEELQLKVERIAAQRREISTLKAELAVQRSGENERSIAKLSSDFRRSEIKGNSPAMQQILQTVSKVANTNSTVLIRGESGTGKELLARVLHDNSERATGPMIGVHCAALSSGLLESELFGHVKGAFTGAEGNKIGRFEAASGGTLFLDEIGDISLEVQIKLLRVLQERCFEPVGASKTIHVDVRVIAATHQDLEQLITEGRFREDLYYRLNVISLKLPSLRERPEDMIELAVHFLDRAASKTGKQVTRFDDDALAVLESYLWPGNIRELENVIERAVVMADFDRITIDDLPLHIVEQSQGLRPKSTSSVEVVTKPLPRITTGLSKPEREIAERETIVSALAQCNGNKAQAARNLGMPRSTLYSKVKKYGIG